MITRIIYTALYVISLLFVSSCSDDSPTKPPVTGSTLSVALAEADYTSLKVQLKTTDSLGVLHYALMRNDVRVLEGQFSGADTVVTDTGLTPSTDYRYRLIKLIDGNATDSSDVAILRTKDTTSSEFEWEVTYFG